MEEALRSREFILREIAPVEFLNGLLPPNDWHVEIDHDISVVTTDGDPSDQVSWNETLRSLVWINSSAECDNIMSGNV